MSSNLVPVVNYKRLRRISPPESDFKFDLNFICTATIAVVMILLFVRYRNVNHKRAQFRT